jgi:hypothetical protein
METDTPKGIAPSFYTDSRGNTKKLVYRVEIVQRNCNLDDIAAELYS